MNKLRIAIILPVCFAITFFSCNSSSTPHQSACEIADVLESAVPLDDGYHTVSEKYFDYYFKYNGSSIKDDVTEFDIRCSNSQSSENEFGIIKATSGKVQSVEESCRMYLDKRKEAYIDAKAAYSPEEYEKYSNARLIRLGNTVVYFILSPKDAEMAEKALSELIK